MSYRYIETPIRRGALAAWFGDLRTSLGMDRVRRVRRTRAAILGFGGLTLALVLFYVSVDPFDAAIGGTDAEFSLAAGGAQGVETAASELPDSGATVAVTAPASLPASATPTTAPALPRRVVVVGGSQAHALAINLPDGIGGTFQIADGSIDGCGVYDTGSVVSARNGFKRSFGNCAGWAEKWGASAAAAKAQVALVVVGAWDVFDVKLADRTLTFGTPEADAYYLSHLQQGIDALKASGSKVALLEVACMRPKDVKGAGVPALPERANDQRTGHVNALLKQAPAAGRERVASVASRRRWGTAAPGQVVFAAAPTQWRIDPAISTDLGFRWDGVHVYKPGANLIYETIAPD